jgi:hypothetical protein
LDLKRVGVGIALAAALALLAFVVLGTKSLDSEELEADLVAELAPQLQVDEDIVDVSCPDDVEVEAGTVFDCDASAGEQALTVEVELTDDDGSYTARLE